MYFFGIVCFSFIVFIFYIYLLYYWITVWLSHESVSCVRAGTMSVFIHQILAQNLKGADS